MKKVFYFNLNTNHHAASKLLHAFNYETTEWHDTVDSAGVAEISWILKFDNYSTFMSATEACKPLFDYYFQHRKFDIDKIEKLYAEIPVSINMENFRKVIDTIDKNVELVKQLQPDIILIRFYSYYEFALLYFLDKIKDIPAFKAVGGADLNFNNWYYIDKLLDDNLIDNFHDGYGERHVQQIVEDPTNIPAKTCNYIYERDDRSIPTSNIHWIVNTILCNGNCKFCIHNRTARQLVSTDVKFTSDEYVDFITDRLKMFQENGVERIFVPGSITFYNKAHLEKFHAAYTKKNLNIKFVDTYFKFEDLDAETFPLVKDMNFQSIKLGLETINAHLRTKVGKTFPTEKVYEVTNLFRQYDIQFKYSFIINFPFSNHNDLYNDLQFVRDFNIYHLAWSPYELFDGTEMELYPDQYNLERHENSRGYTYYTRHGIEFDEDKFHQYVIDFRNIRLSTEAAYEKEKYYDKFIMYPIYYPDKHKK